MAYRLTRALIARITRLPRDLQLKVMEILRGITDPHQEPPRTDPTDPAHTDPPRTDPPRTDPPRTDPPRTDPPPTDPGQQSGDVIAILGLEAPTQRTFVIHGTIPIPKGEFPRADGQLPYSIQVGDTVYPTSVETVSTYANSADGSDIVEVAAMVQVPTGTATGQMAYYNVVKYEHPPVPIPLSPDITSLLATPQSVILRAKDVFGHTYTAEILKDQIGINGTPLNALMQTATAKVSSKSYHVMKSTDPIGAPNGALEHLFGVHAYLTLWDSTNGFNLSLRVHNGFDGYDAGSVDDNGVGVIYFKNLELVVPNNLVPTLDVRDSAAGNSYSEGNNTVLPIISAMPNGAMHMFPQQAQLQRRIGIATNSTVATALANEEAIAFVVSGVNVSGSELYSWWNKVTARFGPQKHVLPSLAHVGNLNGIVDNQYGMIKTALESGNPGDPQFISSPAYGWAHPWGVSYGGMTGGNEINLYDGMNVAWSRKNKGWKAMEWTMRMYMDRQPTALYDSRGNPSELEKWVVKGGSFPFIPFDFWQKVINGDPFGWNNAQQFQIQYVKANGLEPAYQNDLSNFSPIDFQHYIRVTRSIKVLAFLGNDFMAKDELHHLAENYRFSHHEYPNSSGKKAAGSNLWDASTFITSLPDKGIWYGRGEAWGADAMIANYSLAQPAYRNKVLYWFNTTADIVTKAQIPCTGFIQGQTNSKWLDGKWRIRAQPEHSILDNAMWSLKETVFRNKDAQRFAEVEAAIANSAGAMIGPMSWSFTVNGPWWSVAVAPNDFNQPVFCAPVEGSPDIDNTLSWCTFAYGYELTKNPAFLARATEMSGGGDLLTNIMNSGVNDLEFKAALLALLQNKKIVI